MPYSLEQIAAMYGHSKSTLKRHMKDLRKERKFKKSGKGKFYNEADVLLLSKLLTFKFTLPTVNGSSNTTIHLQAHTRSLGPI